MGWQVLCITKPGSLSLKNNQCLYDIDGEESVSFPLDNLSVVIIETLYLKITSSLLKAFALNNIVLFFCGDTHQPCGLFYPYMQHFAYPKIAHIQKDWSEPFKKRLWQSIITAKITNQAKVLELLGKAQAKKLYAIAACVDSGDLLNKEGFAAAIYWRELFGQDFIRGRQDIINAALNYSYAIIRGVITRELAASGFIPCFGIHHDNNLNQFNLADDIIEPFRPVADKNIATLALQGNLPERKLTPLFKQELVKILFENILFEGENLSLMNAAAYMCKSLSAASIKKDYRLLKTPCL